MYRQSISVCSSVTGEVLKQLESYDIKDFKNIAEAKEKLDEAITDKKKEIAQLEKDNKPSIAKKRNLSLTNLEELFKKITICESQTQHTDVPVEVLKQLESYDIKDIKNIADAKEKLDEAIAEKKKEIVQLEKDNKPNIAKKRNSSLTNLEELHKQLIKISISGSDSASEDTSYSFNYIASVSSNIESTIEQKEIPNERVNLVNIVGLKEDLESIKPVCAEKNAMELMLYFQQKLCGLLTEEECINLDNLKRMIIQLENSLKQQGLLSEDIKIYLEQLHSNIFRDNILSTIGNISAILKKIRPLNIQEIRRLIEKADKAAALIKNKDIILLLGDTGVGKSTTIQFLAGVKMQAKQVPVDGVPGKFLDHIEGINPIAQNPMLKEVISDPRSKSQTKYLIPVNIPLRDVLGAHETGEIILCDVPGLDDTGGAEIDIANAIGVLEAIKKCNSVQLLVFSCYPGLGARGQGIQKVAHILTNMVRGIKDRLNSVSYVFTKYPTIGVNSDINSLLIDIKKQQVDPDPILRSDEAFVSVLNDMIDKTDDDVPKKEYKINVLDDRPKALVKKLKRQKGIMFPEEVFNFSISERSIAVVKEQIQIDRLNIISATKNNNYDLIAYYLQKLNTLKVMLKQSFIIDPYEESVRFVMDNINEYCTKGKENFNAALRSSNGITVADADNYIAFIDNIAKAQVLQKYLEPTLISHTSLMQHIMDELIKQRCDMQKLSEQELSNSLVKRYLNNMKVLMRGQFKSEELKLQYNQDCQYLSERFELLVKSISNKLLLNEFQQIAEIILTLSNSLEIFEDHLDSIKIKENYSNSVKLVLQYLNSFSEKATRILDKGRLSENDVETLNNYMGILRSAKDTHLLQEQISKYFMVLRSSVPSSFVDNNTGSEDWLKDSNKTYNEFIENILGYFRNIEQRIKELVDKGQDHVLDEIERLIKEMEVMRAIPEIEIKTANIYYRTVENIRGYVQRFQLEAEHLIVAIEHKEGVINYGRIARSLAKLKNAEWINRVSPGAYDILMRQITDELVQHAQKLEERFMKLDLSLKHPENVCIVQEEIFEQMDSMSVLERSVPDLKKFKESILQRFIQSTKNVFDNIQRTFNLQDNNVYQIKQSLQELEQIKREYENLHPAKVYLLRQEYSDIVLLESDILELQTKHESELDIEKTEKLQLEHEVDRLSSIALTYLKLTSSESRIEQDSGLIGTLVQKAKSAFKKENVEADNYLKEAGYSDIDLVYGLITRSKEIIKVKEHNIQALPMKYNKTLTHLKSIKEQYNLLLEEKGVSQEELSFLQSKSYSSPELLNEDIQNKKRTVEARERNKQQYDFSNKLDASTANSALIYVLNCEKTSCLDIKNIASDTCVALQKYIKEYGVFLNNEILMAFKQSCSNVSFDESKFKSSNMLGLNFQELINLKKYEYVFNFINGDEKIEYLHGEFRSCFDDLSSKMDEYQECGNYEELKNQLIIAQSLSCLDRNCPGLFAAGEGFGMLFRKFRIEVNQEIKQNYKDLLSHISEGDYANANIALEELERSHLPQKDLAQIAHDLQSSLNKLMIDTKSTANWLRGKIEREEDNREQIREIIQNIEKARVALSKNTLMSRLDTKTEADLRNFGKEIDDILSTILLKGLQSIEAFMDVNSFSEAEQGMENLSRVQLELKVHCTSKEVTSKKDELEKRLEDIVNTILRDHEFKDIKEYPINPPRDLLAKLKIVSSRGNAKYIQAYESMSKKINTNFLRFIEEVRTTPLEQRSEKLRSLNYALCFLPDEWQKSFKTQIDELTTLIAIQDQEYKKEVEACFSDEELDEPNIRRIAVLAKRCKEENMHEIFRTLKEKTLKKAYEYLKNIEDFSNVHDMRSIIDVVYKLLQCNEAISTYIPEFIKICSKANSLISRLFLNSLEILNGISKLEQVQIVEKSFDNIVIYINFSCQYYCEPTEQNCILSQDMLQKCVQSFEKTYEYFYENFQTYCACIDQLDVAKLCISMSTSSKWNSFLQKIRMHNNKLEQIQSILQNIAKIPLFIEMISNLDKKTENLFKELNVELITENTTKYEEQREAFFVNLAKTINTLSEIKDKIGNFLQTYQEPEVKIICQKLISLDFLTELKNKIERIGKQLVLFAEKENFTFYDADQFRKYYHHLISINKHIHIVGLDVQEGILQKSEDKIFQKIAIFRKKLESESLDTINFVTLLINMKFFSENLYMFKNKINQEIDEVLKSYKSKHGHVGVRTLCIELEKKDIGLRLIAEHSALKGEDWRKRREKMQNQDNISYILKELSGDDIDHAGLSLRYINFRNIYDNLITTILGSFDQKKQTEPNLEGLITQTKLLAGLIPKKFVSSDSTTDKASITWNPMFQDQIPELLAHVFAIWTLKNTDHYNAERGIEAGKAYLLIPHAAQVIAVFRILGIGYNIEIKEKGIFYDSIKKIPSNKLSNNLVEIGTGEGKSVVMAVIASVFALIGLDVNCSCYSETLSKRDEKDFASLFNVLGITDRIKYGTFNKLCEDMLNEQCNVREKVNDIIANNKNMIETSKVIPRIRPKVLLIDEVDVFLSNKFYGGTYIPSVYLKDPVIKSLLDVVWQKKAIKLNLNIIKATEEYKACNNKYSNWTFLLEEAVKDMLASLQSYKSSTYIVRDDRIVYVEGESIVENVVRGYDTIWAYYHEKERGNISASSLEVNVGIIINCGIFSYAEMPHDFAYIAGVTGTLKTLASVEKDILKRVYKVNKNTFMPSVFGPSNRNYNPISDVKVVSESEYFMNIRGEIDIMCHAKRAILVFFESEEKLLTFYNSSALSSIKDNVNIITEQVSPTERELLIKMAATEERVTLLTRMFGRGLDFICRNQQVLANGGVHVLQTFFSEELAEEYQIMGRGARQGDRGSYRMILLDMDLEWVLGSTWREDLNKYKGVDLYAILNEFRNKRYEGMCGAKELSIEQCKAEHRVSKEFMKALTTGDIEVVKKFLAKQNKGAALMFDSRTVVLMDATGSMSSLLSATKETVCTMFERASIILNEKGIASDSFQVEFAVYRDYDCREHEILQSSSWTTKPQELRSFMNKIIAKGGGDYEEAIEIGLWHAVQESETPEGISQVILIGDAPAKDKSAIARDRKAYGGESYWSCTRFNTLTHYSLELEKLRESAIPVHAFYIEKGAETNFREIATETGGRCEELKINSSAGAEYLTNLVTEEILRKTAGDQGEAVVELYRAKYRKTFLCSNAASGDSSNRPESHNHHQQWQRVTQHYLECATNSDRNVTVFGRSNANSGDSLDEASHNPNQEWELQPSLGDVKKPSFISKSEQEDINLVAQFLHHVSFGEQNEAEKMLKTNIRLATTCGDLTDCAGNHFKKITGFQYAVWALDYHMWTMIRKYLTKEETRTQLEELTRIATLNEQKGWVIILETNTGWPSISWLPLIHALETYVENYKTWNNEKCSNFWCQQVGGAQLILPAHVINEYSHPLRPFYPCPEWGSKEAVLPRTGVDDWVIPKNGKGEILSLKLKDDMARSRGRRREIITGGCCEYKGITEIYTTGSGEFGANWDLLAVKSLFEIRSKQCNELLHEFRCCSTIPTLLMLNQFANSTTIPQQEKDDLDMVIALSLSDTEWFDDDKMNTLLQYFFGDKPNIRLVTAIDAYYNDGKTLLNNLKEIQLQQILEESVIGARLQNTIIIPINLGNMHWAALHIYFNTPDRTSPIVNYFDPFGHGMPDILKKTLMTFYASLQETSIMQCPIRFQYDGCNCGPWTIAILDSLVNNQTIPNQSFNINEARMQYQEIFKNLTQRNRSRNAVNLSLNISKSS